MYSILQEADFNSSYELQCCLYFVQSIVTTLTIQCHRFTLFLDRFPCVFYFFECLLFELKEILLPDCYVHLFATLLRTNDTLKELGVWLSMIQMQTLWFADSCQLDVYVELDGSCKNASKALLCYFCDIVNGPVNSTSAGLACLGLPT